jgi:hypothetical protein
MQSSFTIEVSHVNEFSQLMLLGQVLGSHHDQKTQLGEGMFSHLLYCNMEHLGNVSEAPEQHQHVLDSLPKLEVGCHCCSLRTLRMDRVPTIFFFTFLFSSLAIPGRISIIFLAMAADQRTQEGRTIENDDCRASICPIKEGSMFTLIRIDTLFYKLIQSKYILGLINFF